MASKTKGQFIVESEWAKHLRKWGKKFFWSSERKAAKNYLKKVLENPKE
jgi:hypothetical protein